MLPRPFESGIESLLPNPVYLLLLLSGLAIAAVRLGWPRRARPALLVCAAWAYAGTTPGFTRLMASDLEYRYPRVDPASVQPGTDIVLLASGSVERHEGRAVPRLDTPAWERTAAAASLWQRTRGRLLVLGGPVMDGVSPARAMAEAAVAMGVPREAVTADDRGDTTITAFQLAPRPPADAPPWLVTSALHLPRAMLAARQAGWPVRAFPCDYTVTDSPGWRQWMPSTLAYRRNVELVHEYVGSLAYRWKER